MLETHIKMSSLIFHLAFLLILLLVLCPIFLMDLNIAHMILVHERVALCIVALVLTHVLIVVLVPPRRHGSPARGAYSHFEPSRFDGPHFSCRGSHHTLKL
jgi:hypothetical protein